MKYSLSVESLRNPYMRSVPPSASPTPSSSLTVSNNVENNNGSAPISMFAQQYIETQLPGVLERLDGEPLASGAHGVVWRIPQKRANDLQRLLTEIRHGQFRKFPAATDVIRTGIPIHGDVALKIQFSRVLVERKHDPEMYHEDRARWKREVKTMAALSGFAPAVYTAFTSGYIHFIAMDLIEGTPIDAVMQHPRLYGFPNQSKTLLSFERQIQSALWALWKRGFVHLDLHGENILVRPNGKIVIIDFGESADLPRHLRPSVRMPWWNAHTYWKKRLEKESDAFVVSHLHKQMYNPNAKIIPILRKKRQQFLKMGA